MSPNARHTLFYTVVPVDDDWHFLVLFIDPYTAEVKTLTDVFDDPGEASDVFKSHVPSAVPLTAREFDYVASELAKATLIVQLPLWQSEEAGREESRLFPKVQTT